MKITYLNPSTIILPEDTPRVRSFLTYNDKSVAFQISRLKKQAYYGGDWVQTQIDKLKAEQRKLAGWVDDQGRLCTYSGLAKELASFFGWEIENNIVYPERKALPWHKKPDYELWQHQSEAVNALLDAKHGAISCPTGSGKSKCLVELVKAHGLKTIVTAPNTNIARQLEEEFVLRFGQKYVGFFGDGSKVSKKLITVATIQSLMKLEPGNEHFENLSKSQVYIVDESHQAAPDAFQAATMKVGANAPYRYFVSATQLRTDGSEKILKGITGPIVYSQSFSDLVEKGVLARPVFKVFSVRASMSPHNDPKTETRNNFYKNANVNDFIADVANKCVTAAGRPTVILVEEFSQVARLYPRIKVPFVIASGSSDNIANEDTAALMSAIPKELRDMSAEEAISQFVSGKVKLLIGTNAVATGIDLKPTQALIYAQGGKSEIKVKQGIGRGTRIVPGKKDCWVIDISVQGSDILERHAQARIDIYESLMGDKIEVIK